MSDDTPSRYMESTRAKIEAAILRDPAIDLRSQARQDAIIAVSRARERGGALRSDWSAVDADTVHAITDLLLLVQTRAKPE